MKSRMVAVALTAQLLGLGFATLGHAADAPLAGNAEAGAAKSATCGACHGADGMREVPLWTGGNSHLAGMDPQRFANALNAYRFGQRFHPMMQFFVLPMSDKDVVDMGAYYASLGQIPAAGGK